MAAQQLFSVVIPAYNEEKLLSQCLDSLVSQKTKRTFEVIMVNNNSTDKTVAVAQAYQKKLRLKILTEKQKGRGAARNTGFKEALGSVILSTDADTVLPENWLETMANAFEKDSEIIAVTNPCMIHDCSWIKNEIFNFTVPIGMRVYRIIFGHYWLSGFGFAIKKSVYEKTTGFDRELNAMEDIELSFQVSKLGKIQLLTTCRPIFSGRRFQSSLLGGVFEYFMPFVQYLFLKKKSGILSDVRD